MADTSPTVDQLAFNAPAGNASHGPPSSAPRLPCSTSTSGSASPLAVPTIAPHTASAHSTSAQKRRKTSAAATAATAKGKAHAYTATVAATGEKPNAVAKNAEIARKRMRGDGYNKRDLFYISPADQERANQGMEAKLQELQLKRSTTKDPPLGSCVYKETSVASAQKHIRGL
ncbi:hypothetical protein DFJ73DRAFT_879886, partial [Zopfochytrium polystomum]